MLFPESKSESPKMKNAMWFSGSSAQQLSRSRRIAQKDNVRKSEPKLSM